MSKITQAKKALKEKAGSNEVSEKTPPRQKTALSGIPNIGKCVTCTSFPHHENGHATPCRKIGKYVARKCAACEYYKCKFES